VNNFHVIAGAGFLAVTLSIANILLKSAAAAGNSTGLEMYFQNYGKIGAALCLYTGVFFIYPLMLRIFPLNILFPVYTGLTILAVAISGILFFDEKLNLFQYLGLLFLVSGIFLMTLSTKNT